MRLMLLLAVSLLSSGRAANQDVGGSKVWNAGALAADMRQRAQALDHEKNSRLTVALPAAWRVQTPERLYTISTEPVQGMVARSERREAAAWLRQVAGQLESYEGAEAPVTGATRARLRSILARSEFAASPPPGEWEKLQERINSFVAGLLKRLFGGMRFNRAGGWAIYYFLLVVALGALGYLGYRWLQGRRTRRVGNAVSDETAVTVRPWQEWLRAAQRAADAGDLRKAIQCAYWTGVTRLQDAGELPRAKTLTPREYLRALQVSGEKSDSLRRLTSDLERFWYAGRPASLEDVRSCLGSLESLGCRAE